MKSNSKHKTGGKHKKHRKMISQFFERLSRKCRLIKSRTEQNNDLRRIIHKRQFCSSFKNDRLVTAKIILILD